MRATKVPGAQHLEVVPRGIEDTTVRGRSSMARGQRERTMPGTLSIWRIVHVLIGVDLHVHGSDTRNVFEARVVPSAKCGVSARLSQILHSESIVGAVLGPLGGHHGLFDF